MKNKISKNSLSYSIMIISLLLILKPAVAVDNSNLNTGLLGFYNMNETSGQPIDYGTYKHNVTGTYGSGFTYSGNLTDGIYFNAANSRFNTSYSSDYDIGAGAFSLCAVVTFDGTSSVIRIVGTDSYDTGGTYVGASLSRYEGLTGNAYKVYGLTRNSTSSAALELYSSSTYGAGPSTMATPTMFCNIRDGSNNLNLYVNNVSVASGTLTAWLNNNKGLKIGGIDETTFTTLMLGKVIRVGFWNRSLNVTELNQLMNGGSWLYAPFTGPAVVATITFQGQTPSNASVQFYTNPNATLNTTTSNLGGTITQSHYFYNASGTLLAQNNQSSTSNNYTSIFTSLPIGILYFNATATNGTNTTASETRTLYIYNITNGSIIIPTNGSIVANRYLNITWSNATITPSAAPVIVSYHEVFLYNSSLGYLKRLVNTTNLNLTNWDVYNENLTLGTYYLLLNQTDNNSKTTTTSYTLINITTNAILNITAYEIISGASISTFNGWVYNYEQGTNTTYTTTSGQSLVNLAKGNLTVYLESGNYSLNNTIQGINLTNTTQNAKFYLYFTNTLNITFHNQATPTVILSGPSIILDLISDTYSTTSTTTNGTMYLTILTPETYTLRYRATGFTERFYVVTVTNRTYQELNLYMINSTGINVTVSVVDYALNPLTGVNVQSLKYDLTSNTYILQEIHSVNTDGQAIFSMTYNDEYWKFIVTSADGTVLKMTDPTYITSNSYTIQVGDTTDFSEEMSNYGSISSNLVFNTASNNFRLDYSGSSGIIEQILLTVYINANTTYTLYNTSNSTSASGSILVGVAPVNGTTYAAYAYYLEDGEYKYLTGLSYTYPVTGSSVWGNTGLFIQILLTLGASSLVFVSPVAAMILSPLTLVFGAYVGFITLGTSLIAGILLVLGIIMAVIIGVKK